MRGDANLEGDAALLIPCSGMGKVHGLIGREAVYAALGKLGPEADTVCLALIVTGDEETLAAIRSHPCITVDGCPKLCACKNVELAGGKIAESVRVVDALKTHKGAQPGTATCLAEDGWAIAAEMAEGLANRVRTIAVASGKE